MKIIMIVPKVVQKYLSQFPENRNDAYGYFNYDNRVVEERMDRGDAPCTYKGPDEFSDGDYDGLLTYAKTLVNPILQKYSPRVACEDALHMAIKSFGTGQFDGKVNANKFAVLLASFLGNQSTPVLPVMASRKNKEPVNPVKPAKIPGRILKQLGVSPRDVSQHPGRGTQQLVKYPGGDVVLQKSTR